MSVENWIKEFRAAHEAARKGKLSETDQKAYLAAREQFARALMGAQGLTVEAGKPARRMFRVAQGLQVDIELASGSVRAMTLDISCGGFSVYLSRRPGEKETPGVSLRLPGGVEPLVARTSISSITQRPGNVRVGFTFVDLPEKEAERLEGILVDLALARMP